MPFSNVAMNHAGIFHWDHNVFSIEACLNIEDGLISLVLFSVSHMLYLETTTKTCSLKYVFLFKTWQTRHTDKRCEHITIIGKVSIIIKVI